MPYKCSMCGEVHDDLPHIGSEAPYQWADRFASDPQSLLTEDLCIIEGRDYFVRGVLEIPVHDYEHEFGWGVWVSHKKENFEIYRENSQSADIGPFFGWLCTAIDYYDEPTLSPKTMAHYRGEGLRPTWLKLATFNCPIRFGATSSAHGTDNSSAPSIASSLAAVPAARSLPFATLTYNGKSRPAGLTKTLPLAHAGTTITNPIRKPGKRS